MFSVELGTDAKRFLRKAEKDNAQRIIKRIEKLKEEPFPQDVKRVVGKKDKIFRERSAITEFSIVLFTRET